jgi:hypothetical protein
LNAPAGADEPSKPAGIGGLFFVETSLQEFNWRNALRLRNTI